MENSEINTNKKNRISIAKPQFFTVRLSDCGVDSANGSYKIMKKKNAVELITQAVVLMAKDMVGNPENNMDGHLIYTVGLELIRCIHKHPEIFPDMDELDEKIKWFTLK